MGGGKSLSIRCQCTVDCRACGLISPSSRSLIPPLLLRSTKVVDRESFTESLQSFFLITTEALSFIKVEKEVYNLDDTKTKPVTKPVKRN
jgi:hypothetical protein